MTASSNVGSTAITFRSSAATRIAGIHRVLFCGELEHEGAPIARFTSEVVSKDECWHVDTYLEATTLNNQGEARVSDAVRSLEIPISTLLMRLVQTWEETPEKTQPGLERAERAELN